MAAITVSHVSKRFSRPQARAGTLKEWLVARLRPTRPAAEPFWALRDVSFTVRPGEAVGLVGANGSGKSTMLKLLTGIMRPTTGEVGVVGRVSALLELGAGFHPDFTGRENVFLNGAILGIPRAEVAARFDEIVAFAELADFIDAPVKTYSSGMYMRLAFAIAVHVDPDVLLIDEVLAVGDAAFQRRCLDRLRAFRQAGKTIVLVTHDAGAVAELCDRAVWLRQGAVAADGPVYEVLEAYGQGALAEPAARGAEGPVRLGPPVITGAPSPRPDAFAADGAFRVTFEVEAEGDPGDLTLMLKVFKHGGICCYTGSTPLAALGAARGRVAVELPAMPLLSGTYVLEAVATTGPVVLAARQATFTVHSPVPGDGVAPLHCHWSLSPLAGAAWDTGSP